MGLELELFTVARDGSIVNKGMALKRKSQEKVRKHLVSGELGEHQIEIITDPKAHVAKSFLQVLDTIEHVIEAAKKLEVLLYPYGTHPGEFEPTFRKKKWYEIKEQLVGTDKFKIASMCSAFQFHYSLSRSVFDRGSGTIKVSRKEKSNVRTVSLYNFLIAADPVVATLMQSSPFMQGYHIAKDSRVIYYRGGENLRHEGLHSEFQLFGGLQPYINTVTDILRLIEKRYDVWRSQLLMHGFDPAVIHKYGKKLDYSWNPIKINKVGTFEIRGMDMNLPSYCLGMSYLLQEALHRVNREELVVTPSDIGIHKPFTVEKNKLYIPPESMVHAVLQYSSAVDGLKDPQIYDYCKAFVKFALETSPKKEHVLASRIGKILEKGQTVSDEMLRQIKDEKIDLKKKLNSRAAKKFATDWCYHVMPDLQLTRKLLERAGY